MKPLDNNRYACGDCHAVFDLTLAPLAEWAEAYEDVTDTDIDTEPTVCPFCGAGELKLVHDRPTVASARSSPPANAK